MVMLEGGGIIHSLLPAYLHCRNFMHISISISVGTTLLTNFLKGVVKNTSFIFNRK
jgi:hypothetical protein